MKGLLKGLLAIGAVMFLWKAINTVVFSLF